MKRMHNKCNYVNKNEWLQLKSFGCEISNLPPHKTVLCTSEDEADCEGDDEGVDE